MGCGVTDVFDVNCQVCIVSRRVSDGLFICMVVAA